MAERIRLFKGVTELDYSVADITITDDYVINTGKIEFIADSSVISGSVIDFKKSDGSTTIFSGKVQGIVKDMMWTASIFTNGYELMNKPVQNVYINRSPEYIVADVVNNYTENLTFASTETSGFTISSYIANSYGIDIIKDMMDLLDWKVIIDVNDNVYFVPNGTYDNGLVFTNGSSCNVYDWEENQDSMINHVKIIGGFESFATEETVTGTGTVFDLSKKPAGAMVATVSAAEVDPTLYTVDANNKTVTFDSSVTDPTFSYSYDKPVVVENQDDASISLYGEIFKKIPAPWLNSFADARKYAQSVLDTYSEPLQMVKVQQPGLNFDISVGETATVIDNVRNKEEVLEIKKVFYSARNNTTTIDLGERDSHLTDWQREVEERIKKIEQQALNEDEIIFTRLFKTGLQMTISHCYTWKKNSPTNTFTLGHPTLNRLRSVVNGHIENYEADCSDNGHYGTWYGTGIDGSQYTTSGYRLYGGTFNGSDNYIQVNDTVSGIQSINFFAKPTNVSEDILQLTASAYISINADGEITTTGLTNPTIYINGVAGISIGTGTHKLVTVTCDSINGTDIEIGRVGTSYYTGEIDEVLMFDNKITTASMALIVAKDWYDIDNAYTISGILAHLSMDNPKLGIRETAKELIETTCDYNRAIETGDNRVIETGDNRVIEI